MHDQVCSIYSSAQPAMSYENYCMQNRLSEGAGMSDDIFRIF